MFTIKNSIEIGIMGEGGRILARVRDELARVADVGITLKELDKLAEDLIKRAGAQPAFLGYRPEGALKPYPASICTSVNEVVVHGTPNNYKLKSGDVLKIDLGVLYKGFYTDTAMTVGIGKISDEAKKLIVVTKKALELAVEECQPHTFSQPTTTQSTSREKVRGQVGKTLGDIGFVINKYINNQGFKVIKGLMGHGIGRQLHEDPIVPNEGKRGVGQKLVEGMILAIEPMVSAGRPEIKQLSDESYATVDKSLSAQFEHTVAITNDGPEILTL